MYKNLFASILALVVFFGSFGLVSANNDESEVSYDYFYSLQKALTEKNYAGLRIDKNTAKLVKDKIVVSPSKTNKSVFELHLDSGTEGKDLAIYEFLVTITPSKGKPIDGYIGIGDNTVMMEKKTASGEFTVLIYFEIKGDELMVTFEDVSDSGIVTTSTAEFMGDPVIKFFINPGSAAYTIDDVVMRRMILSPFEM